MRWHTVRLTTGPRAIDTRDHNLIRPLALRELRDLMAGGPAVPFAAGDRR